MMVSYHNTPGVQAEVPAIQWRFRLHQPLPERLDKSSEEGSQGTTSP